MSMTLATTWVRRGVAAQFPTKYAIDEEEISRISELARLQLEDAREDLRVAQAGSPPAENSDEDVDEDAGAKLPANSEADAEAEDDDLKEYHLDDYDEDEVDENGESVSMFGNVRSLAYYAPDEKDPYLVLPEGENEDDEEREELQILATDNVILAAKVEDEVAHLEVFVYEDEADNLYVHHDIMLPAVPLCVEWLDRPVGRGSENRDRGNFCAVGTMNPEIEIWDLDVVDIMYPNEILGQEPKTSGTSEGSTAKKTQKKKKKKKLKPNDSFHVDAVLALAANRQHRNLLTSASADTTVKLWDLPQAKCAKSYSMHSDKVCALDWHPSEAYILLSGSYDRTVVASDMRAPDVVSPRWRVEADVERVRWNPHDSHFFFVTTEAGTVHYFDARNVPATTSSSSPSTISAAPSKRVWTLQAHDGACSAFDINPLIPDFIATGSDDKKVKLWNLTDNKPNMIVSRNLDVGRVFSTQFAPDPEVAFRLTVAGSKGNLQVWDTSTNAAVRRAFAGRQGLKTTAADGEVAGDRLINVNRDSSDEDDGDEGVGPGNRDGAWDDMDED